MLIHNVIGIIVVIFHYNVVFFGFVWSMRWHILIVYPLICAIFHMFTMGNTSQVFVPTDT